MRFDAPAASSPQLFTNLRVRDQAINRGEHRLDG
jgi:hypothetical protein